MVRSLPIFFLLICISRLPAQENKDTIEIKKYITAQYYVYQGKQIYTKGLYKLTLNIPAAHEEMVKARRESLIQTALLATTVGCLVWGFAKNTPQETSKALFYTAGGLSVAGIVISFSEKKHEKKAVQKYNQEILIST